MRMNKSLCFLICILVGLILLVACSHHYNKKEQIYPIDNKYKVQEFLRLSFEDGTLKETMCIGCGGYTKAKIETNNEEGYIISWPCQFCKFDCDILLSTDGEIEERCPNNLIDAEEFIFNYLKSNNFDGTIQEVVECGHRNDNFGKYKTIKVNNGAFFVEWRCAYYQNLCSACLYENNTVTVLGCTTMSISDPTC